MERHVNKRRFATCEGFAMPIFFESERCADCSVQCSGRRYGVCSWKSWVIEIEDKSASTRTVPARGPLAVLLAAVVRGIPSKTAALVFLLLAGSLHGFEMELIKPSNEKGARSVTQEVSARTCLSQHGHEATNKFLKPFAQSVLHSVPLGNIKANVSAWVQLAVGAHQILAASHATGGILFWEIGSFDLLAPMSDLQILDATWAQVLTSFHVPGELKSTYLTAGCTDGSLRVWRLDDVGWDGQFRISVQLQLLDTFSHGDLGAVGPPGLQLPGRLRRVLGWASSAETVPDKCINFEESTLMRATSKELTLDW